MHWLMDDACLLTLHADTIPCSGLRAAGVQEEQLQGSFPHMKPSPWEAPHLCVATGKEPSAQAAGTHACHLAVTGPLDLIAVLPALSSGQLQLFMWARAPRGVCMPLAGLFCAVYRVLSHMTP